jgi:hypothetical protein
MTAVVREIISIIGTKIDLVELKNEERPRMQANVTSLINYLDNLLREKLWTDEENDVQMVLNWLNKRDLEGQFETLSNLLFAISDNGRGDMNEDMGVLASALFNGQIRIEKLRSLPDLDDDSWGTD